MEIRLAHGLGKAASPDDENKASSSRLRSRPQAPQELCCAVPLPRQAIIRHRCISKLVTCPKIPRVNVTGSPVAALLVVLRDTPVRVVQVSLETYGVGAACIADVLMIEMTYRSHESARRQQGA